MTRNYSNSIIFNYIREKVFKVEKPYALGWGQWEEWENDLKARKPVAFFFTETLPDWIQKVPEFFIDPFDDIRCWIRNYLGGSHKLDSKLKRGQWHEFEERLLHSCFDSFVDFIEGEYAGHSIAWSDKEAVAKYEIPWHQRFRWLRWGQKFNCKQAAIDHMKWEMSLDEPDEGSGQPSSPHQAAAAREKMALYVWWTEIRPTRKDDWTDSGLRQFWDEMDEKYGDGKWHTFGGGKRVMTAAEERKYNKLSTATNNLEEVRHQEDEEMLIRLIKLRRALWT